MSRFSATYRHTANNPHQNTTTTQLKVGRNQQSSCNTDTLSLDHPATRSSKITKIKGNQVKSLQKSDLPQGITQDKHRPHYDYDQCKSQQNYVLSRDHHSNKISDIKKCPSDNSKTPRYATVVKTRMRNTIRCNTIPQQVKRYSSKTSNTTAISQATR